MNSDDILKAVAGLLCGLTGWPWDQALLVAGRMVPFRQQPVALTGMLAGWTENWSVQKCEAVATLLVALFVSESASAPPASPAQSQAEAAAASAVPTSPASASPAPASPIAAAK